MTVQQHTVVINGYQFQYPAGYANVRHYIDQIGRNVARMKLATKPKDQAFYQPLIERDSATIARYKRAISAK
uniref:Uncharacterized protein n=1 Tax=viral metagenome TaxID=1070528 RepID=A0A6M3LG27_9ZZZZ